MRSLVFLIAALLAGPALAQSLDVPEDGVLRFHGYAYDLATNAYIYTEVHEQHVQGGKWTRGTITYYAPSGAKMGVKVLDFADDEYVPRYTLSLEDGYYEAITAARDSIVMERRKGADRKLERSEVRKPGAVTADSGFHSYIRGHFRELLDGRQLKFQMAVPGSLDTFKFKIQRMADTRFEGIDAVRFRVQPDSLLRFVVDPLELTYDPRGMLLEFRGISNVHDPKTGKQYTARITYPAKPPAGAPADLPPLE